jgi:DNA uptake protein ComE-like DNA-binding protein
MAKGHWLDPLARSLLAAMGQLPPGEQRPAPNPVSEDAERIERELLGLKLGQNPGLRLGSAEEVRHAAALGWRLDVNRATAADWLRLPGCTPRQVDLLLRLQGGGVQISGPEDLQRVLELPEPQLRCWEPLLLFRWYGSAPSPAAAPIDLNQASAEQLERHGGLSLEQIRRLIRERQRGGFLDLADLQDRLQLPAEVVEGLIGKVRFGLGPVGPSLPRPRSGGG